MGVHSIRSPTLIGSPFYEIFSLKGKQDSLCFSKFHSGLRYPQEIPDSTAYSFKILIIGINCVVCTKSANESIMLD